jgi:acetolactate synthase-1/2/3 large subunit
MTSLSTLSPVHPGGPDDTGTISAAEALVRQLESYGVEYVFGLCGHTNIALSPACCSSMSGRA